MSVGWRSTSATTLASSRPACSESARPRQVYPPRLTSRSHSSAGKGLNREETRSKQRERDAAPVEPADVEPERHDEAGKCEENDEQPVEPEGLLVDEGRGNQHDDRGGVEQDGGKAYGNELHRREIGGGDDEGGNRLPSEVPAQALWNGEALL